MNWRFLGPGWPAGWSLGAVMLAGCATSPVTTLAAGGAGRIAFESHTLMGTQLTAESQPTVVWGDLGFPKDGAGPAALVILVPKCAGVGALEMRWVEELRGMGLATFLLDSFGGRGITEVCTGRHRFNTASLLGDAYRALELLATHPRIDPARIAIMGFSLGGRVALWSSLTRFQRLLNPAGRHRFAAYLPFYPAACNIRLLDEAEVSGGPIRIFLGTADDVALIGPCREYVARMRQAGRDVDLIEYPGAPHAFDNVAVAGRPVPWGQELNEARCTFVEVAVGKFVDLTTGRPPGPDAPCFSRGYAKRYDPVTHRQAIMDVKTSLYQMFKMGR